MKRMMILLLAAILLLGLCACGKEEPAPTEAPMNVQPKEEATPVAPETTYETQASAEAAPETAAPEADKKALAESCIDKDISELYALIGEPESSDYAPSCLEEGGEDGSLYYDGFVVYTLRVGDVETVFYVE